VVALWATDGDASGLQSPASGLQPTAYSLQPAFLLAPALFLLVTPLQPGAPLSALWTFPAVLLASLLLAWAAESAQFFVAQGLALALLAWLQTAPEFAVEAVIAWKQRTDLMIANLTGALRLLTGLGWPMIYFTAAVMHRRRRRQPLQAIKLDREHAIEVVALIPPIFYFCFVWWKSRLELYDGLVLAGFYSLYLWIVRKMPHREEESIEELELVPRKIMQTRPPFRSIIILGLFAAGGVLIFAVAEPFLASMLAISLSLGVPSFVFVQWVAPFLSEFPEKVSAFYWARTVSKAPVALMNMVSSNINQWTMLPALLPVVYSISLGRVAAIPFGGRQELEILMTIGQALVAMMLLMNMNLAWWEAGGLFLLWAFQFALSPFQRFEWVNALVTAAYFGWFAVEVVKNAAGRRNWRAIRIFVELLRQSKVQSPRSKV
jgi:cation:H+ antiporter